MGDTPATPQNLSLGQYLAAVRSARKMTLRQVEEMTNKEVSNAYLSQIENDKIQQPSPNILNALAEIYSVDFIGLMNRAGYIKAQPSGAHPKRHGRAATFADMDLTADEEAELLKYLRYYREHRK